MIKILNIYNNFSTYKKDSNNIIYCRDENKNDWYEIIKESEKNKIKSTFLMIENNIVICSSFDPSTLYPDNSTVVEIFGHIEIEQGIYVFVNMSEMILKIIQPPNSELLIPKYNGVAWIDQASEKDIEINKTKLRIKFYNDELNFAQKALTEKYFGLVSDFEYNEVVEYMKSINPYSAIKEHKTIERPLIFKKYI